MIFCDEKKWNLDGPDGYHYYWHDLRQDQHYLSKRPRDGRSVTTWIAFSREGKLSIAFTSNEMRNKNYQKILEESLLPFLRDKEREFIFMQKNASVHVSKDTLARFKEKKIQLIAWPACSPDLNPTESLFGILTRNVFREGRQYKSVKELKNALLSTWSKIPQDTLDSLVNSMSDRIFEVIRRGGKFTHY